MRATAFARSPNNLYSISMHTLSIFKDYSSKTFYFDLIKIYHSLLITKLAGNGVSGFLISRLDR